MIECNEVRLDPANERLWLRDRPVELRPKTWQVLRLLVERAGRLVTTAELLDAVWPEVRVTPGTLTQSIAELRRVLGDDAHEPRFIQTVHRRGYRFIAELPSAPRPVAMAGSAESNLPPSPALEATEITPGTRLAGRESELARLDLLLAEAQTGRRQIVFVTGEPGIGKTSLVRTFLQRINRDGDTEPLWITGGKCIELVGEGEAYLPVMEALEGLTRVAGAERLARHLRRQAPAWLAQLPTLLETDDGHETPELAEREMRSGMLRQFCTAMEALSAEGTVVLWLEDLHWGDLATVDLLAALAARTEPARLLVLATYRANEAELNRHPIASLERSLIRQRRCVELPLALLDSAAVRDYLQRRFGPDLPPTLAAMIHHLTDGNPLFMVTVVNHMVTEGWLTRAHPRAPWRLTCTQKTVRESAPESLVALVEAQFSSLDADTAAALAAGSVAGEVFTAQTVAAALGRTIGEAEQILGRLAGPGQFLEAAAADPWPDGSAGERYRFRHALLRQVVYRRLTAGRRQDLHRAVAQRLEQGYLSRHEDIAASLALHFERGGDPARAVHHLVLAAAGVRQRAGDREAVAYFERALELLAALPESDVHARQELELRWQLWGEVNASMAFSTAAQDASLGRALELATRLGDLRSRAYVLSCRTRLLIVRSKLDAAAALLERRVSFVSGVGDPVLLATAHGERGDIAFYRGQLDRVPVEQQACVSALEGVHPREASRLVGHDPAVLALGYQGWAAWLQGHPDQARVHAAAGVARAEAGGYRLNRAVALLMAMKVEKLRRDVDAAQRPAKSLAELVQEHGFELPFTAVFAVTGWMAARRGQLESAIRRLSKGVSASRNTQARQGRSHLRATLAETQLEFGATAEALETIEQALAFVEDSGERFWEAEIHRLKGELMRADDPQAAERCFGKALEVARGQGARALELRAATSLARLLKDSDRQPQAASLLGPVYDSFSEGLGTLDLREARALLDALPRSFGHDRRVNSVRR